MHFRNIIPALALLAPLISAQSENDTPIVSAFVEYMENEGFSSLNAEGLTAQASLYSELVDSIEGELATAAPSDRSFVESYVSSAVFADPSLSSVMASITSEYGDDSSTPTQTDSSDSASASGSEAIATSGGSATPSASSEDAAHAVDTRYMGFASAAVGAAVLGFAVFL